MAAFTNGPAQGIYLGLRRAPWLLRVVQNPQGTWDALDQLDDVPDALETVVVYRKVSDDGACFVDGTSKTGRRVGWSEVLATYTLYEVQPEDAVARDTTRWRAWATEQACASAS